MSVGTSCHDTIKLIRFNRFPIGKPIKQLMLLAIELEKTKEVDFAIHEMPPKSLSHILLF